MSKNYFLSVLIMLACLTGCNNSEKHYLIGVSQCSDDEWRQMMNDEFNREALLCPDIDVEIKNANDDSKDQIADIEEFISKKVDLLIVAPNEDSLLIPVIEKAYDKGIPVVLVDRRITSDKYTAYVGGDNVDVGRQAGNCINRYLSSGGLLIEIGGLQESTPAQERHRGMMETLHRSNITHMVTYGNWSTQSGYNEMRELLSTSLLEEVKADRTAVVFCHNDRMTMGAIEAAKERDVRDRFLFIGVDGCTTDGFGVDNVINGMMKATCYYPTGGEDAMKTAIKILHGESFDRETLLPSLVIDANNAEVMKQQSVYSASLCDKINLLNNSLDESLQRYSYQKMLLSSLIVILILIGFSLAMALKAYWTNEKLRKHMEDSANAKLSFFTNVSHDFRTPLTLIADPVAQLLRNDNLTENERHLLNIVRKNVTVLLRLINQILDFRKYESGKLEMRLSDFNITSSMAEWTESFQPIADSKNIDFKVRTIYTGEHIDREEAAFNVIADTEKLERITYNLLSNALKFTPDGGKVRVLVQSDDKTLNMRFSNTGKGLSQDELEHIFDNFYQASVYYVGSGIGLALVKAFVEMHNGTVVAKNQYDDGSGELKDGTSFIITMPLRQSGVVQKDVVRTQVMDSLLEGAVAHSSTLPVSVKVKDDDNLTTEKDDNTRPSVLIIDDSDDVRQYVGMVLSDRYSILEASNGREGLEKAVANIPDIIICDVMMPVMDGMECLRQLKKRIETSHIPVLMLTAYTRDQKKIEGYSLGVDSYIEKPFSSDVLRARIDNLIDGRRQLQNYWENKGADSVLALNSGATADTATEKGAPATSAEQRDMRDFPLPPLPHDITFMEHLQQYILDHISDSDLSVEDMSEEFNLGRTQMYRKVKAMTGMSPIEMLKLARIRKAAQMLSETERTISEITYACGFTSPSYFTKCFREHYKKTPTEYRG